MLHLEKNSFTIKCEGTYRLLISTEKDEQHVFEKNNVVLSFMDIKNTFAIKIQFSPEGRFYIISQEIDCDLDFSRLFTDDEFRETVKKKIVEFQKKQDVNWFKIDSEDKKQTRREIIHMFAAQVNLKDDNRKSGCIKKNFLKTKSDVDDDLEITFNQNGDFAEECKIQVIIQPQATDKAKIDLIQSTLPVIQSNMKNSIIKDMQNNPKKIDELIQQDLLEIQKSQTDFLKKTTFDDADQNAVNSTNIPNFPNKEENSTNIPTFPTKDSMKNKTFIQKNPIIIYVGLIVLLCLVGYIYLIKKKDV